MHQGEQPGPAPREAGPHRGFRYRSAFWGVVLVALGVLLLLYNFDVVSRQNLAMLGLLWPILLVGIGVDLLVGRRSWGLGGLVGVVTVGLIIVLMFAAPGAGWVKSADVKTETLSTPVGAATSARVTLYSSSYGVNVHALPASVAVDRPLLKAHVTYQGTMDFQSSGDQVKTVTIQGREHRWWWGWFDLVDVEPWDVGLDPAVPLDLKFRCSSGSSDLDLSGLLLTAVEVDMSSGDTQVKLPALDGQRYPARLHLSSGDLGLHVAAGAQIDLAVDMSSGDAEVALGGECDATVTFEGSSGAFTLDLAAGQAVRVEVRRVSSGDVDLPSGLIQVAGGDDDEGAWETEDYGAAAHKVHVIIERVSSGDVEIRVGG